MGHQNNAVGMELLQEHGLTTSDDGQIPTILLRCAILDLYRLIQVDDSTGSEQVRLKH